MHILYGCLDFICELKKNNKESVSKAFYLPSVELGSLSLSFSDRDFLVPIIGVGNAMCFSDNAV